jgi:hypothetical protein
LKIKEDEKEQIEKVKSNSNNSSKTRKR